MFSLRTVVLPLALGLTIVASGLAQAPATTSSPTTQAQAASDQASTSVSTRIRERREKRRAAAMHDAYSHLYDASLSAGYERFILHGLQRVTEYSWDTAFTRYYSERFGVMLDLRGSYGSAFIQPLEGAPQNVFHPRIYQYTGLIGTTYRFYRTPRVSVSGRLLGGGALGKFSGDYAGNQAASTAAGLYPDGGTFAMNAAIVGEYNFSPNLAVKIAPEYNPTFFGSSVQNNRGVTLGLVYRFGKQ